MKINWVRKNQNNRVILFFNGWGMDSSAIAHLKLSDYDFVELNDYSELCLNGAELERYDEINVIAWSFGVWASALVLTNTNLCVARSIAINGTLNPVHTQEGINPAVFEGTLTGWNEKNRERFWRRIIGGSKELVAHRSKFGTRSIDNQRIELAKLYDYCRSGNLASWPFDTALIGWHDAIFLPQNQLNYWQGKCRIKTLDMPHYPFLFFQSWDDILSA